MQYLLEIKNRIILLLIAWLSTIWIIYIYKEILLFVIIQPYTCLKESISISYFIFTDVTEILSVYLNLILFLSCQVLYAYTMYHFFLFLSPALFYTEYLFCKVGIKGIAIMLMVSIILSTYLLIPITWHFFLSFQNISLKHSLNLHFEARLKEYLYFYVSYYFICIFYFQFFTFLLFFLNSANFNVKNLKELRRFNYYCFILLSTVISPPEIISQFCIGFIVILIYEFTLLIYLFKTHC